MPKLQPVLLLLASVLSPFYLFISVNGDARLVITSDAMDHEVGGRGLSFFHFCDHDVTKLKHFLGSTLTGCKYKGGRCICAPAARMASWGTSREPY